MTTTNQVELSYAVEDTPGVADNTATRKILRYNSESLESLHEFEDSGEVDSAGEAATLVRLENSQGGEISMYQIYGSLQDFFENLYGATLTTFGAFFGPNEEGEDTTFTRSFFSHTQHTDSNTNTFGIGSDAIDAGLSYNGIAAGDILFLYGDTGHTADFSLYDTGWRRVISVTTNSDGDVTGITTAGNTITGRDPIGTYVFLYVQKMVRSTASLNRRLTIQKSFRDANLFHNYYGCLIEAVRLDWRAGGAPSVSLAVVAQSHNVTKASVLAAPSEKINHQPFSVVDFKPTLLDSDRTVITDPIMIGLTVDLERPGRPAYNLGDVDPAAINIGTFSVTGRFEVYFQSEDFYQQFLDNDVIGIFFRTQDPTQITSLPNENYRDDTPFSGSDKWVTATAEQRAFSGSLLREYFELPRVQITGASVTARGFGRALIAQFEFQGVKEGGGLGGADLFRYYRTPSESIPDIYRRAFMDYRIFNSEPLFTA